MRGDIANGGGRRPVRRALISVHDKTGLAGLATGLADAGVALVSTGSTAERIGAAGVAVTRVEDMTGFPECLDGRVKTLHPGVHAGILADVRRAAHREQLAELGIEPFDLVVVNLYPFAETARSGAPADECVEQIDIGGPAMVRSAAKNHANVAVVVSPARYGEVVEAIREGGSTLGQRQQLAAEAFEHTATYDLHVARWFGHELAREAEETWPRFAGLALQRQSVLRYGENPHQPAALYVDTDGGHGLAQAEQLHGQQMSYNNYVDAMAAHRAAYDFDQPSVAIIKHTNPCGIAIGADVAVAHAKAHACDPVSAFGGVIAANRLVTLELAEQLVDIFTEVVVAPGFEAAALKLLCEKHNIRLLRSPPPSEPAVEWRVISGGALAQGADRMDAEGDEPTAWELVSGSPGELTDLEFAWRVCRGVKSNAIVLAADGATVGIGMGQVNRVDSARLAVARAGERARGAVAASDAFFPFPDGLTVLAEAGVVAVVQPGGSIRDAEVVAAARAAGITMYHTGTRHFAH